MTDYIDRKAAIVAIEELILPKPKGAAAEGINSFVWRCAINCAEERIRNLPSIDHARHVTCEFCKYLGNPNYCPDKSGQLDMADYCSWGELKEGEEA